MAVRLGSFETQVSIERSKHDAERECMTKLLWELMDKAEPFVEDMIDIYDTYHHIKNNYPEQEKFVSGLWTYLCDDVNHGMGINSYWTMKDKANKVDYYINISVSRYGICMMYDAKKCELISDDPDLYNSGSSFSPKMCDKNVWRGKLLASKYLQEHIGEYDNSQICKMVKSMEHLLVSFPKMRDGFFNLVDKKITYKR